MGSEQQETQKRMVKIWSYDGVVVEVPEAVAIQSVVIKHVVEDVGVEDPIPTPNVVGDVLSKVFEYCTKHAEFDATTAAAAAVKSGPNDEPAAAAAAAAAMEKMENWDRQFINLPLDTLHDVLNAADYLEIQGLLDLCLDKVASAITQKTAEEIRRDFNIQNDFTPEEEEAVRREHSWAHHDAD
uniref:SKP1-like protein n=1 Tax=Ananas comosus var. bracteatus TaxID=296719 RepID=A0A6V7QFS1_ANACO|nr:unnamed protein product [Ananas comosus var. bracteatus]